MCLRLLLTGVKRNVYKVHDGPQGAVLVILGLDSSLKGLCIVTVCLPSTWSRRVYQAHRLKSLAKYTYGYKGNRTTQNFPFLNSKYASSKSYSHTDTCPPWCRQSTSYKILQLSFFVFIGLNLYSSNSYGNGLIQFGKTLWNCLLNV